MESRGAIIMDILPPYGAFVIADAAAIASLAALPFVAWTGVFRPAYRIGPSLLEREDIIEFVGISVVIDGNVDEVVALVAESGEVVSVSEAHTFDKYVIIMARLSAEQVTPSSPIVNHPDVRWLEYAPPFETEDERSTQIVSEDLNGVAAPNTGPNPNYANRLLDLA